MSTTAPARRNRGTTRTRVFAIIPAALLSAVVYAGAVRGAETPARDTVESVVQNGHTQAVRALAFSSDGRLLASGGADRRLKVWDAGSGHLLRDFSGFADAVRAVAFVDGARFVVAGSNSGQVQLWETSSGRLVWRKQHAEGSDLEKSVEALSVSPDGSRVATLSAARVRVWMTVDGALAEDDVAGAGVDFVTLRFSEKDLLLCRTNRDRLEVLTPGARKPLATRRLKSSARVAAAFSENGALLAVAEASTVTVIGWRDNREVVTAAAPRVAPSLAFSTTGTELAHEGENGSIVIRDLRDPSRVVELTGHQGKVRRVYSLAFDRQGSLASGGGDHAVHLWKVATSTRVRSMLPRALPIESLVIDHQARLLAAGAMGDTGDVALWDLQAGDLRRVLRGPSEPATVLDAGEEARWISVIEENLRNVDLMGASTLAVRLRGAGPRTTPALRFLMTGYPGSRRHVDFSPRRPWLASGSLDGSVHVWDVATGEIVNRAGGHPAHWVGPVMFAPDGATMVSADENGLLLSRRPKSGALVQVFQEGEQKAISSLALSADGRWLAAGSEDDGGLKLWDLGTGETKTLANQSPSSTGTIHALAFSPDSQALLASRGNELQLWDVSRRTLRSTLPRASGTIHSLAVHPVAPMAAYGTDDGTIVIFDYRSGKVMTTTAAHSGAVWGIAFHDRGRLLVSASEDTAMRLWDTASGELLLTALVLDGGREWLVVSPDGLFDGSPGSWEAIRWRFDASLYDSAPVEVFFNEFFHPGLLRDFFEGQRPVAARQIASLDRRQPIVALTQAAPPVANTRVVRIDITVDQSKSAGSGARDLRLFRNGSLVKVWRGDLLGDSTKASFTADIPITAGENRFTAYCFNRDNVKSATLELLVQGDESLKRRGTAFLLAIGINKYANADYNLRYAVEDVSAFAQQMQRQWDKLQTFAAVEPVLLTDREATKANILLALRRLSGEHSGPLPAPAPQVLQRLRRSEPEDGVFVYFAGHGTANGPRFYLIPHDLGYAGKRGTLNQQAVDTILSRSISDQELELAFASIDAARLLLVIDACNSGQALEAEEKRRGPMNSQGLAQLAYEKGMNVLTASQGYQAALEAAELGHGYLTYALVIEGLTTPVADVDPKDGRVFLREWLDYGTRRVPEMQLKLMQDAHEGGRELAFVEEELATDLEGRSIQRPRVFYRREPDSVPLVVATPAAPNK